LILKGYSAGVLNEMLDIGERLVDVPEI